MQIQTFALLYLDYNAGPNGDSPMVTPEQSAANFHKIRPLLPFSQRVMLRTFIAEGCDYAVLDNSEIPIEVEHVN